MIQNNHPNPLVLLNLVECKLKINVNKKKNYNSFGTKVLLEVQNLINTIKIDILKREEESREKKKPQLQ